jgi:hypothetical protein
MPPKINHEQRLPRHNIQNKVDFTGRLLANMENALHISREKAAARQTELDEIQSTRDQCEMQVLDLQRKLRDLEETVERLNQAAAQ